MKIPVPQLPEWLERVDDLLDYALRSISDEDSVSGIVTAGQRIVNEDIGELDAHQVLFEDCELEGCKFDKASFVDVVFRHCNLSNCSFVDCYLSRCRFEDCKCVGINLGDSVIKQTVIEQSSLRYACLDKAKLTEVALQGVDLAECSISEARLKDIEVSDCRFIRNNFVRTPLGGIDFADGEFRVPTVSTPPTELRGITVSPQQAVDLVSLWGIVVK